VRANVVKNALKAGADILVVLRAITAGKDIIAEFVSDSTFDIGNNFGTVQGT